MTTARDPLDSCLNVGEVYGMLRSRRRKRIERWSSLEERELCNRLEQTAGVAGKEAEYAQLRKLWAEVHEANERGESPQFISDLYASHVFEHRERSPEPEPTPEPAPPDLSEMSQEELAVLLDKVAGVAGQEELYERVYQAWEATNPG